ncbi:hypothetical protein ABGA94_10015, partial [Stenotrophomonas sp. 3diitr2024]
MRAYGGAAAECLRTAPRLPLVAMAGIPLLNGFLSKEMLFAAAITAGGPGIMRTAVSIAALLAGV